MEKGGGSEKYRCRDTESVPMRTLMVWTRAQYEAQSACSTENDVLRIAQRCTHMHTHTHTKTIAKKNNNTQTHGVAVLRKTPLCECPAGRKTGRHRTHHYYQITIVHNRRGGGWGGKAICLTHTYTQTHIHFSVRIKWLREHKQLKVQWLISRQYVNWILIVLNAPSIEKQYVEQSVERFVQAATAHFTRASYQPLISPASLILTRHRPSSSRHHIIKLFSICLHLCRTGKHSPVKSNALRCQQLPVESWHTQIPKITPAGGAHTHRDFVWCGFPQLWMNQAQSKARRLCL